jgi:hypothetical protein
MIVDEMKSGVRAGCAMECIEPGKVSVDELFALAMGEDSEPAATHAANCPSCAATVEGYADADRLLHSKLARVDCPATLTLGELILGILDPSAALDVRAHLADCHYCASDMKLLALELAGDPLRELVAGPSLLRRLAARLVPVPAPGMSIGGVRGGPINGPRTYDAENVTILLTDHREGHGAGRLWTLLGLVDIEGDAPPDGTEVRLTSSTGKVDISRLDTHGNFSVAGLQPGTYSLELHLSDRVVDVESIEIGSSPA